MWRRVPTTATSASPTGASPAADGTQPPAVLYQSRATGRCLSLEQTNRIPKTLPCAIDGRWPPTMLFTRAL